MYDWRRGLLTLFGWTAGGMLVLALWARTMGEPATGAAAMMAGVAQVVTFFIAWLFVWLFDTIEAPDDVEQLFGLLNPHRVLRVLLVAALAAPGTMAVWAIRERFPLETMANGDYELVVFVYLVSWLMVWGLINEPLPERRMH